MHFTRKSLMVLAVLLLTTRSGAWAASSTPVATPAPLSAADILEYQQATAPAPVATPAAAQVHGDSGELRISVAPALWMARVRGNTSQGGQTFSVDGEFGLNDYEATFNGELSASWGVFYKVMLTGWFFSTNATSFAQSGGDFGGVPIAIGDRLSSDFSAAGAGAEFDMTLWRPFADQKTPWGASIPNDANRAADGQYKADLRFKAIGAVRWYSASLSVNDQTVGASSSYSMGAVMPGIGAGIELDLHTADRLSWLDSITLESSGATGMNFSNGQYFVFIRASVCANFNANFSAEFGYRLEDYKLDNSNAVFDGGVQGLFAGIHVDF